MTQRILKSGPPSMIQFPNGWTIQQNLNDANIAIFDNNGNLFGEFLYNGTNQPMIELFDPRSVNRWVKVWLVPAGVGTTADVHIATSNGFINLDSQVTANNPFRVGQALVIVSAAIINTSPVTLTASSRSFQRVDATTGAITVNLPAANAQAASGQYIIITKIDSSVNAVTVTAAGSDKIEGGTTKTLSAQYSKTILISDGGSPGIWYDVVGTLV